MINHVSEELGMILNLRNVALDHKKNCNHNCNVSLFQLKAAARYIRNIQKDEVQLREIDKLIEEMPNS